MKMINYLFVGLCLFLTSCSKNDDPEKKSTLKEKLIGKWIEVSPCDSCSTFTFSQNDTIYQINRWDTIVYRLWYQVINDDSIQVSRIWDIGQNKETTKNSIVFLSNDTITIGQFTAIDFGSTGFQDIKLTKTD